MPRLTIVTRDGQEHEGEATAGRSVMRNIQERRLDDLLALCGGCCSCGTCHVYVDPDWFGRLGPVGADEECLLNATDCPEETSRLSCQILFTSALDGLRVRIAPED